MLIFLKDFTKIFVRPLSFKIVSSSFSKYYVEIVFLNEYRINQNHQTLRSHFPMIDSNFPVFAQILPTISENTSIAQEPRICKHISNRFLQYLLDILSKY